MWGRNLLFAAREEAADRHLFALAVMSDTSHRTPRRFKIGSQA
jgi:hypothetical protein